MNRILNVMYADEMSGMVCSRAEARKILRPLFVSKRKGINWEEYLKLSQRVCEEVRNETYLKRDILNSFLKALEMLREISFNPAKGKYWVCYYQKRKFYPCLFLWAACNEPGDPAFFMKKTAAEDCFRAVISSWESLEEDVNARHGLDFHDDKIVYMLGLRG